MPMPVLLLATLIAIAGCGATGEVPVRYYLVNPITDTGVQPDSTLAVELIDIEIPQYLERFQLASRRQDNQLVFATSHQWAENLRKNLLRTMARNLTTLLGTPDISTPSNRSSSSPQIRVRVFIEQFERDADGYVKLIARWQLTDSEANTSVTRSSRYTSSTPVNAPDYAATVTAMGDLFGELSRDIASAIRVHHED